MAELTDAIINPRHAVEMKVVHLLVEEDLESYLLCAFSRNDVVADGFLGELKNLKVKTWTGLKGVSSALHWLGLKEYATDNAELVKNVRTVFGGGWWFTLDWDLAQIRGSGGFGILGSLSNTSKEMKFAADAERTVQDQQTDKNKVFHHFREWIGEIDTPPGRPDSVTEFRSFAEILYWIGHLKLDNNTLLSWIDNALIESAMEALPIHLFAELACAIQKSCGDTYQSWLAENRKIVERKIRESASIMALVEDENCLIGHFAIDIEKNATKLSQNNVETNVNDLAVERVEVISRCLPGYEKYGAAGYGHQMTFFESLGDDSVKRIQTDNIIMPWLPDFNALARGLVEIEFRPNDWQDYFKLNYQMRESVVTAFQDLRTAAGKVSTERATALRDTSAWDKCKHLVNGDSFLPRCAVDEWGFVSESRSSKFSNEPRAKKFNAISALEPFNKAINEYTRTVGNFMQQAIDALVLVPNLNAATTKEAKQRVLAKAKELNVHEGSIRLSVLNGIDACIAVRKLHQIETALQTEANESLCDDEFRAMELSTFLETMRSWAVFTYPNQILRKQPTKKKKRPGKRPKRIEFRDVLATTRNRISDALKKLEPTGIDAKVLSDRIQWKNDSALWIAIDAPHPLASLIALEKTWFALVEAFKPDREKMVRTKAIDYFWKRIVFVPLTGGKSLERQALPHMNGVTYPLEEDLESQIWRFHPEPIPESTWKQLNLQAWDRQPTWDVFDEFAGSYGALFHHIDHMADFSRCNVDLDELGEEIFLKYLEKEQGRTNPLLQATFDTGANLIAAFPEIDEQLVEERPNMFNCINLIIEMRDALMPTDDFDNEARLTIDEIAGWRDRLKSAFNLLGEARTLWISDALGFKGFDYDQL